MNTSASLSGESIRFLVACPGRLCCGPAFDQLRRDRKGLIREWLFLSLTSGVPVPVPVPLGSDNRGLKTWYNCFSWHWFELHCFSRSVIVFHALSYAN